jgi:FkbM family methyltransferase
VLAELPVSGDGVYGDYSEYASFLIAVEQAVPRRKFNAIELGAGWGPWISSIAVVCRRLGFDEVSLIGVEADEGRCRLMREHLARNRVAAKVIHGAAWKEDGIAHFPVITDPRGDHGAAATADAVRADYRGWELPTITVPAFSLRTISEGMQVVDYMHWDIQGAELEVIRSDPEFMNTRVRYLFIGTHSPPIEGGLIEFFFENQWDILHLRPCYFEYDRSKPSIEAMATGDGELVARNPRLT